MQPDEIEDPRLDRHLSELNAATLPNLLVSQRRDSTVLGHHLPEDTSK